MFCLPVVSFAQLIEIDLPKFGLPETDISTVAANVVNYVAGIISTIAVLVIIYGAFIYLSSGGNQEQAEKAKKIITYAIIGLVVVGLAWVVVTAVARIF
ncbi:hypothetical protein COY23_00885 [bacterium (Candidatus Torokbacteria) CG_4_10_14_0_2_um_filter_35_8]|nr:MAG: hypothetical protein COY23_00885 [bacterium (Candidatus Torokbacteria) CG_4_10_14_0_2_um_filter_35_8]